jgi:hypothetical protein
MFLAAFNGDEPELPLLFFNRGNIFFMARKDIVQPA